MERLKFPIVSFVRNDHSIYVNTDTVKDRKSYRYCWEIDYKRFPERTFKSIDAEGRVYVLKSITIVRRAGFWGWFPYPSLRRRFYVDYEYEPGTGSIALEDMKAELKGRVADDRHFWEDHYDLDELDSLIENAGSYAELYMLFY